MSDKLILISQQLESKLNFDKYILRDALLMKWISLSLCKIEKIIKNYVTQDCSE